MGTERQKEHASRYMAHQWLRDPPFDDFQLVMAGFGKIAPWDSTESWKKLFCSEFVSSTLKIAGISAFQHINTSTVSPNDLEKNEVYSEKRGFLHVLTEAAEHDDDILVDMNKELATAQEEGKKAEDMHEDVLEDKME